MVEIIDTNRDNRDDEKKERKAGVVDDQESSDSDDSDDDDVPDGSAEGKQGIVDQLRDYKKRDAGLHRQHRGMMQWKVSWRRPGAGSRFCFYVFDYGD